MASTFLKSTKNPLQLSDLKNHAIAFHQIEQTMYWPRIQEAIKCAKEQIAAIRDNNAAPTFENTILALETSGEEVDLVSNIFHNQFSAHTSDELQELALKIGPLLASYSSDILLDTKLFHRIETVYKNENASPTSSLLDIEQKELLEKVYSNFTRNGARLSEESKAKLRSLDEEMSQLAPRFSENVLKATNAFSLVISNKADLAGLPEMAIESAQIAAQEKGYKDSWLFSLQTPSYMAFMQHGQNREIREKLYRAYSSRATTGELSNVEIVLKILELREKRAQLLGYKNHASFVLEKRMAESPEKVFTFLKRIQDASLKAAHADVQKVQEFAKQNGGPNELMPWDFTFWSERLKEHLFQFNDEDLRPYFELSRVVAGAFAHAEKLYGLTFKECPEYPVYHSDVRAYEVYDKSTQNFVGLFYADFFPRESKRGGAWMTNYIEQGLFHGEVGRPHVAIVCNFTKPTKDKPALITFEEVQTLFHEFGHSLHGLLSQCQYRSTSGTNVYWDFVELPSQIMENWTLEKDGLDIFARHYKTGEKIPAELVQKINDSSNFLAGYMSLRQVTFALLDMAYHTAPFSEILSPLEFEEKIIGPLRVLPKIDGANASCSFAHIFAGGYSAGYYSYKWAEVLDADAFELFKEKGLFDSETAKKFKEHILSRGGTEHPMTLYKRFRGREPDPNALLRRDGLI